ncbi:MAG TPA: ABC transporter permease [Aggregatilineales bacterium]|nr:ABC transporter permease [Aggregatilineales bacterium]
MQRTAMQKRMQRLSALIRKEAIQVLRDRRTLVFILGLPLIELFLFAYAVSLSVYHLPTAIIDQSKDAKSREFIQAMINSQYFDPTMQLQSEAEGVRAIDAGQVKASLVIPPNFAADTEQGIAHVLIILDGSDSFSVQSGASAASAVAQNYALTLTTQRITRLVGNTGAAFNLVPVVTSLRVLYNPDLRDLWFLLPAIIGMIMQTLAVGQAALVVVRERELGTIEQILATPTRPLELILAKMFPLLVLVLLLTAVILGLGVFWFGVPFQGSLWLYFWLSLLFITSSLGLGLLISAIAKTQRQAQQITTMLMLFSMLLTGLIYPRDAMPAIPLFIGDLLPLTYFIRISRGIITKGVGLTYLWSDALILVIYGALLMVVAARSFGKRLD